MQFATYTGVLLFWHVFTKKELVMLTLVFVKKPLVSFQNRFVFLSRFCQGKG